MASSDDQLVLVPMPALCILLVQLEEKKGAPLTQSEVVEARDKAVCMAVPLSVAQKLEASRGYRDLVLEDVWNDWQGFRSWYYGANSGAEESGPGSET